MSSPSIRPFREDRKLTDILRDTDNGGFAFSAEIIPPRNGTEQVKVIEQISSLITSGAQFLAVTKGAGGSLRGGSLPIAQVIKERFNVPCIAHFTCRDLTPQEVENQLIDHHYFGIRNILALRGDPPDGQPEWKPREGGYNYAHELIAQIRALNSGKFLTRAGGPAVDSSEKTDFCIGAAAYPEHPNEKERARFFKLKVEAGAEYGITDMLFDPEVYARFLELCAREGCKIPVIPGTRVLKSRAQSAKMAAKFRVTVPQATLDALPETEGPDSAKRGVDLFLSLTEKLRSYGAPGIHLFVISDTASACLALEKLTHA
jgi:methylenetetrahydrofolate reductase (NADPH)